MVTCVCQVCGKVMERPPSQLRKYCSNACANSVRRQAVARTCRHCGKAFTVPPSRQAANYCSISCGISARNLTSANPSYHRDVSGERNPMYGKGRSGEANPMYGRRNELAPRWKGGRSVRPDGYVYVLAPDDHPYPASVRRSGRKLMLEHRLVMEQHLGRYLRPEEVIHHIDNNPTNNAIENLRLFSSQSEHISVGHEHRQR